MFGFTGDLHLGKRILNLPSETEDWQLATLGRALALCQQKGARDFVIGGDLFDTPYPSQRLLCKLADLLNSYRKVRVVAYPGNHDFHSHENHSMDVLSWLGKKDLLPLTIIMSPTVMAIDGHDCFVCPHPFVEDPPKRVDWCLGHFGWTGALRDNGTRHPTGHKPSGNWLLGDFHAHQSGKRFAYAGSLQQLHWSERNAKGFLLVDGREWKFQTVRQSYTLCDPIVSNLEQLESLPEEEHDIPNYYVVRLADGFEMPKGWAGTYTHIRDYIPEGIEAKVDATASVVQFSDDPLEGLGDWASEKLRTYKVKNVKMAVKRVVSLAENVYKDKK